MRNIIINLTIVILVLFQFKSNAQNRNIDSLNDLLKKSKEELKKRYKEVQNAMTKIKAGKYGICEKCSVQIKKERLIAMPIAALCINCAKIGR